MPDEPPKVESPADPAAHPESPIVESATDYSYSWEAIKLILGFSGVAAVISILFGLGYSLEGACLAALASITGYAAGALGGFLFGFPRYLDAGAITSADDLKALPGTGIPAGTLRPSTNLERIVDWLTTMIVGATLVNLQSILGQLRSSFGALGATVTGRDNWIVGSLLVSPFVVAGFLHSYLWARKYLPREWATPLGIIRTLGHKTVELQRALQQVKGQIYRVQSDTLRRLSGLLTGVGADDTLKMDVLKRLEDASGWDDEPFERFSTQQDAGFEIGATVTKIEQPDEPKGDEGLFSAMVSVRRTDGTPFTATVVFLLHNSYRPPYEVREASNSTIVSIDITCNEPSWVAAIVAAATDGERIRPIAKLAMDLGASGNNPAGFRAGGR
jgi:hypothetical protein